MTGRKTSGNIALSKKFINQVDIVIVQMPELGFVSRQGFVRRVVAEAIKKLVDAGLIPKEEYHKK